MIKNRIHVECEWLLFLSATEEISEVRKLKESEQARIRKIYLDLTVEDAEKVKEIEKTTNHDVKAIEYYVKDRLKEDPELVELTEWIHFACTSEDINNTAYAIMLSQARSDVLMGVMSKLTNEIDLMANSNASIAMLSRTHGQVASPTTLGKELRNSSERLKRQSVQFEKLEILGKFNGAVGNFNAHQSAYPNLDWPRLSAKFLNRLGLTINKYTTQIEPHDYIAEMFDCLKRFNQILLDFDRDIWTYVSLDYFKQKKSRRRDRLINNAAQDQSDRF